MDITILSDTRMPTNMNYPGHGLGRALSRIAGGLVERGHTVTVCGGYGSDVKGCRMVIDANEDQRAYSWIDKHLEADVILDGSHHFGVAILRPDWPVVCKVADGEGFAPRNRVYGDSTIAGYFELPEGKVIPEGVDVDNIPFIPDGRGEHLLFASAIWVHKKPDVAIEVAQKAGRPIWFMGEEYSPGFSPDKFLRPQTGAAFYEELARAHGVIYPLASMVTLEAAATGTPGISGMVGDDWVADGITGFIRPDVEGMAEAVTHLGDLDKKAMREWVCDNRSVAKMAAEYETLLERAANGEVW